MRKITGSQVLVFALLLTVIVSLGIVTTKLALGSLPLGDFRGIILIGGAVLLIYLYGFGIFRVFFFFMPIRAGEIMPASRDEFAYHVYLLFFLILFYPVMCSNLLPVPLMRLVYLALGARLGENTYSAGLLLDPPFIEIGSNTLVGANALLVPHVIEGSKLAHYPIRIGNHATIGARAVVLSGVTVEDHGIVATGAVVPKGTHIRSGEVWGGVPARLLRRSEPGSAGGESE